LTNKGLYIYEIRQKKAFVWVEIFHICMMMTISLTFSNTVISDVYLINYVQLYSYISN